MLNLVELKQITHTLGQSSGDIALKSVAATCRSILREHGNYRYLNGKGSIVKLNSGIEFAMIYFAMLLALLIVGGGRYLSLDYYLSLLFKSGD